MTEPIDAVAELITPKRVFLATLLVVLTVLVFFLVYVFANALLYLFIGAILSTALKPLVNWLRNRGVAALTATTAVYALVVLAVLGVLACILPVVFEQAGKLSEKLPRNYQELVTQLNNSSSSLVKRIAQRLPQEFEPPQKAPPTEGAYQRVTQALSYGDWLFRVFFAIIAVILIAFYWSLQEERTVRALQLAFPPPRRESVRELITTVEAKMGAYVRGQGILCLTVGTLDFVAYLVIGLPYATTLGIIAGVLEAVPVFGPVLGAIPPTLLALSIEPNRVIWVIVASVAVQQMENYVLVPRIMGGAVGVNPVATLLAIAAFGSLMGLPGAVLAIPLAALVQMLLDRLLLDPHAFEPEKPQGRDAASVVRYHARDLVHDVRLYLRGKEENPSTRNDSIEEAVESIAQDIDQLLAENMEVATPSAALAGGRR